MGLNGVIFDLFLAAIVACLSLLAIFIELARDLMWGEEEDYLKYVDFVLANVRENLAMMSRFVRCLLSLTSTF